MKHTRHILFLFMCFFMLKASGQHEQQYFPDTDSLVLQKLEKWQDLKFGLLMHWGPYSQWGVVESWTLCGEDEGWCQRKKDNYYEYQQAYEDLKTTFNPVKFDPGKWATAAREAGMKYVVFTTKHHDGFCMFDTKLTDYRITSLDCPFHTNPKANVAKEVFNAFRQEGFWTGAYFSKPDWHSEYYWWKYFPTPDRNVNYDISLYPDRWENYIRFTHGQIDELMSDYGKMDILWLDGGWVQKMTKEEIRKEINAPGYKFLHLQNQDIRMDELVTNVRKKQPGLIVVDRAVPGKNQNYLTPENQVPEKPLPFPWESCIIAGGGWSWVPDAKYKTAGEVVHMLADIVSKGGNLLLNIAPGPDGTFDPDAYTMLAGIGKWMKVNGEAIYGTRAVAPFRDGNICYTSKQKSKSVYAIFLVQKGMLQLPSEINIQLTDPEKVRKVLLLGSDTKISWKKSKSGIRIFLAPQQQELISHIACTFQVQMK